MNEYAALNSLVRVDDVTAARGQHLPQILALKQARDLIAIIDQITGFYRQYILALSLHTSFNMLSSSNPHTDVGCCGEPGAAANGTLFAELLVQRPRTTADDISGNARTDTDENL